jgi:hypothetical protein
MSRKAYLIVIARRNDEAIRLLSGISGLLHSVRNDESGLLRQPHYVKFIVCFETVSLIYNKMQSSYKF